MRLICFANGYPIFHLESPPKEDPRQWYVWYAFIPLLSAFTFPRTAVSCARETVIPGPGDSFPH